MVGKVYSNAAFNGATGYTQMKIGFMALYARALSPTDVATAFLATRARFGQGCPNGYLVLGDGCSLGGFAALPAGLLFDSPSNAVTLEFWLSITASSNDYTRVFQFGQLANAKINSNSLALLQDITTKSWRVQMWNHANVHAVVRFCMVYG